MSFQWFGGNIKQRNLGTIYRPLSTVTRPTAASSLGQGEGPQVCPVSHCRKQFFNSHGLFNHQLQMDHFDNYCCLCDRTFTQRNFKRHLESVHTGAQFKCWMCEKKYNREDNLKAHQFKVHGMVACRYCQAAFRDKDSLKAHVMQGCLKKPK